MLHIFPFATKVRRESFGTFQSYLDLVLVLSEVIVLVACEDISVSRGTSQLNSFFFFNDKMILVNTPNAGLSFVG